MRSAEALSKVFHPLLVLPVSAFLFLNISGLGLSRSTYWFLLWVTVVLVPTAAVTWFIGERSFKVLSRRKRIYSYLTGFMSLTLCLVLFHYLSAPKVVINLGITGVIATGIFAVANHFSKVSIHTGASTAVAAIYALFSLESAVFLGLASILIGWSRIELDQHTLLQVLQGGVLGIVCGIIFLNL